MDRVLHMGVRVNRSDPLKIVSAAGGGGGYVEDSRKRGCFYTMLRFRLFSKMKMYLKYCFSNSYYVLSLAYSDNPLRIEVITERFSFYIIFAMT
jgi:hypothetical protein